MDGQGSIVVTGGAGFIGSALVRRLVADGADVVNVDSLTYAGNLDSLGATADAPNHHFERVDITDAAAVKRVFEQYRPRAVLHLAAESHVDRSIDGPDAFVQTNVVGTLHLLQAARSHHATLDEAGRAAFRFVHVSTDEVFGSLEDDTARFHTGTPYDPRSPYSASKAGSDHLARAWHHTFRLPVIVTNCSNNYGPYQFPEKLIPLVILSALRGAELPVYGDGSNVRDWIYVDDHVDGLVTALERGSPGGTYLFGGDAERRNIDVVRGICSILDELRPRDEGPYADLIRFVRDRPGHDHRYAIDSSHAREALGWAPRHSFDAGLRATVGWYARPNAWVERVRSGAYRGERLGVSV
ncbi:MAG: dTDP-glucose 4,6-dehydratase [Gemmatimonadota bacterium]